MLPNLPPGIYPYKAIFEEERQNMSKVTGQVFKLYDKAWGPKILWSFKLENDPIFYRMNENRGAGIVEPGNYIEFEAVMNPDGKSAQVNAPPVRVEPAKAPVAASGVNHAPTAGGREASILYQSSRKDALLFVQIALANGAVALPAKTSAKLAALDALVDSYTAVYLEDIGTGGAVTRSTQRAYAEEQEENEPAPNPKAKKKAPRPPVEDVEDEYEDEDE